MSHLYTYRASLVEVIDGDTFDFEVDLGFHISNQIRVRLADIDTDEIHGVKKESDQYKRGQKQKRFSKDRLESADDIILKTYKDGTGKYGRYLAEVLVDGEDLKSLLIEEFGENVLLEQ